MIRAQVLVESISGVPPHRPFKQCERILDIAVIAAVAVGAWFTAFGWENDYVLASWFCFGWLCRLAIDGCCHVGDQMYFERNYPITASEMKMLVG